MYDTIYYFTSLEFINHNIFLYTVIPSTLE